MGECRYCYAYLNGYQPDDNSGADSCTPHTTCGPGQKVNSEGDATSNRTCTNCPAGTFSEINNASSCNSCASGDYASGTANPSCSPCGDGKTAKTTNTTGAGAVASGAKYCVSCGVGKWDHDTHAHTVCQTHSTCAVGKGASNTPNATTDRTCANCTVGVNYSDVDDAGACDPVTNCALGSAPTPSYSSDQTKTFSVSDTESTGTWKTAGIDIYLTKKMILAIQQSGGITYIGSWRDQGFDNRKGKLYLGLFRNGGSLKWHYVDNGDYAPHAWENISGTINATHDMIAYAQAGDILGWRYVVGGGGNHELYIKGPGGSGNFSWTLKKNHDGTATASRNHTCNVCPVGYDAGGTTGVCSQEIHLQAGTGRNIWYGPSVIPSMNPTGSSEYFYVRSGGDATPKDWYNTGYTMLKVYVKDTKVAAGTSSTYLHIRAEKVYESGTKHAFAGGYNDDYFDGQSFRPKFEIKASDNTHLTAGRSYRSLGAAPLVIEAWDWHNSTQITDSIYGSDGLSLIVNYSYKGLRLAGGTGPSNGRLEAYDGGDSWRSVCDDNFGQDDADVACTQLGFEGGAYAYGSDQGMSNHHPYGNGSSEVFALDSCNCNGTEKTLQDCCSTYEDCYAIESVWVECIESREVDVGSGTAGETKSFGGHGSNALGGVDNTFVCPSVINKDNGLRINNSAPDSSWPDTFEVTLYGNALHVDRTDNGDAWGWDLAFKCYRAGYRDYWSPKH